MDDGTGDSPTRASTLPSAETPVVGRYRVRRRLGRGASKEVYLAYDERLDREVALALVVGARDAVARERVVREARLTGRLGDHPNVVTVYDSGEVDGTPYLVLRAMPGGSLAEALDRQGLEIADIIGIGRDVAAALAHAHAHGVLHRDVKPDNIWLSGDGRAALGDFGIAHDAGAEHLTADGVVVGTVRYVAPEQIRGEDAGPAADLYALGVTLYELVTGRPPFTGADAAGVFAQHLSVAPPAPSVRAPGVPPELDALIVSLLAKDPAQRPSSAADVVATLERLGARTADAAPRPWSRAALATASSARRVVTVLAGRLADGDPEAQAALLDRCAAIVQRHGGTVERHLGSALVGLFGVHASHDDDPRRAGRAAVELRAAAPELALGLEAGEVLVAAAHDGAPTVTGAAIATAGRLAERAAAGEVLLGDAIRPALADEARVEPDSGRLLELHAERPALLRGPVTPFVGRARDLDRLEAAFRSAARERACHLVTVVGAPGLGKSRLAGELVARLSDEAQVLVGRCPAYGEGTAYWPLQGLVRDLAGDDPRARIAQLLDDDAPAIATVLGAVGLADAPAHVEETAWAFRRVLEVAARDRPVLVAIEDLHWAHDAFVEILDQVVTLSNGAPILVVGLARPELLERHPAWAAPQARRSILPLEPLDEAEALQLARRLGAADAQALAARAEGNPLFLTQLVAVGPAPGTLPVSIHATLAARIDALAPAPRMLLQRAAVEGRTFHAGALAVLVPEALPRLRSLLVELAHKGLVAGDAPGHPGEEAYRFTHVLIREAAYAGVPKHQRADLHTALAEWLEDRPRVVDEVVAHHLETACRLLEEIGEAGPRERVLAARARQRLQVAARTALARGDPAAASGLLERAVALAGSEPLARAPLLPALGAALFEAGRLTEAAQVLDTAMAAATDDRLRARARVERAFVRLEAEHDAVTDDAGQTAETALAVFAAAADDEGQARAWSLNAAAAWTAGRVAEADGAWERAAACARAAGDEREVHAILGWRATAAVLGPTPVDEALRRCTAFRDAVAASPAATASMVNPMGSLHAMRGDAARARRAIEEANATLRELGTLGAAVSHHEALVWMLADRPDLAERPLRAGIAALEAMDDGALLATTTAMLAQAVLAQGRAAEAADLCRATARTAPPDDIVTQAIWRSVLARVQGSAGACAEAIALAREAVALLQATDLLSHRADAMLDLGEVLRKCAGGDEPTDVFRAALSLYEQKGNVVGARRARALLRPRTRET